MLPAATAHRDGFSPPTNFPGTLLCSSKKKKKKNKKKKLINILTRRVPFRSCS